MIVHLTGNLTTGKTTTAEALRRRLGWPVVGIGTFRAMAERFSRMGAIPEASPGDKEKISWTWLGAFLRRRDGLISEPDAGFPESWGGVPVVSSLENPDLAKGGGRHCLLTTTGHNFLERLAWDEVDPAGVLRIHLYGDLDELLRRLAIRPPATGPWFFSTSEEKLLRAIAEAEDELGPESTFTRAHLVIRSAGPEALTTGEIASAILGALAVRVTAFEETKPSCNRTYSALRSGSE